MFVEVKRHGEAISAEQIAEISRLRALGLRAGVFRFNRAPRGSRQRLREARKKYFPNREERHLSQATGYPWEDVEVPVEARSFLILISAHGPAAVQHVLARVACCSGRCSGSHLDSPRYARSDPVRIRRNSDDVSALSDSYAGVTSHKT